MHREFEAKYHRLEDGHWWFKSRRDYFLRLVEQLALPRDAAILDMGCASGPLLDALNRRGYTRTRGIDISEEAIRNCSRRGVENVQVMDAAQPSFPADSFDLIVASDVLEHIAEDRSALANWHRILKPGGLLAVFVPAFAFLWTGHDAMNRHFRRYTKRELTRKLADTRYELQFSSYWNFALFAPAAAIRLLSRLAPKSRRETKDQLDQPPNLVNAALSALLRCENTALLAKLRFPVGVSVMALARKPAAPADASSRA